MYFGAVGWFTAGVLRVEGPMTTCDVCMRNVDDGVSCGECCPDIEEERAIGAAADRAKIVAWLRHTDRDQVFGPGYAMRIERGEHDE